MTKQEQLKQVQELINNQVSVLNWAILSPTQKRVERKKLKELETIKIRLIFPLAA